jgi:Ala-tRNA(Pro) deacylase
LGIELVTVFDLIVERLEAAGVAYRVLRHEPVYTSEEAARVRGVPLASGAKALIVKVDDEFRHFVLPANRRFDSAKARKAAGARRSRFATVEEVLQMTGLRPGAIPPFGSLFELSTYCDPALGENEIINFNAGDHCISVSMRFDDFLRVEGPTLLEIT